MLSGLEPGLFLWRFWTVDWAPAPPKITCFKGRVWERGKETVLASPIIGPPANATSSYHQVSCIYFLSAVDLALPVLVSFSQSLYHYGEF